MTRVQLELTRIKIHRPKASWRLYFLLLTEHPLQPNELVATVIPQQPVLVVPDQKNQVHFEPAGKGTEGLLLLSRELPPAGELNTHLFVMHSRRAGREIGGILLDIGQLLGNEVLGKESELLGLASPWLRLAKAALPRVGQSLTGLPDRHLGFINMYERFGPEFQQENEHSREIRGGHVTVTYRWSVAG
ncbi:MAG: hypothetical protein JNN04_06610 [Cyclobacteriaceae bacterium]|nr:hypothetical protein [Cyclobacteriaceae bacterium]